MENLLTEEALYQKTSQELTSLLYEALQNNLEIAIHAINTNDMDLANERLQKSNDILHRLGVGINYEAGIIADQLDALYNFLAEKVIEANLKKDITCIEDALKIVNKLAGAWQTATKNKAKPAPTSIKRKSQAYEQNVLTEKMHEPEKEFKR